MNITKSNTLSFYNEQGILTLNAKQFDTGRRFVFHIMDNDEPFDLSDCNAYLRIAKADGTQFQDHECCTIDGSKIIIDTSVGNGSQILAAAGANTCELHLEDADGISLTTWNFNILVEPRVHDGSHITSIDSFDILDIAKRNEDTREKNEEIRQSKETKRQESETQRQENETQRQENETQRQENEVIRKSKFEIIENKVGEITDEAKSYATNAKSWAVGGTNTRTGEDTDNSKHYYEQIKSIAESFSGTLRPRGTIAFTALPALSSTKEGDMYNISDQFTTNTDFKEGSGHTIPAGSNIYKTADGKWDVLAGTPVTGIKGANENTYRRGNVNITAEDIGALSINGGIIESDNGKSINILASGIQGDDSQVLSSFYSVEANTISGINICGDRLYYSQEDTDDRYLKKDDTNFLDTKKGGTVNNSFKVNKVSTTNPTGLTELDIHNDGKVAFLTSGSGDKNDSLMHLDGINRLVTLNGTKLNVPILINSESRLTLQAHDNGINLKHFSPYAGTGLWITETGVGINFKNSDFPSTEKNDEYFTGALFHQSAAETRIYGRDIKLGRSNDWFIEADRSTPPGETTINKTLKLRGGNYIDAQHQSANMQLEYDTANGNLIKFYATNCKFYSASDENPLLIVKPTGVELRDTSSDGFTVNGNEKITGNLRLKNSGNYGNMINFGDGDYVHISEPTDDHLEIKASYINFVIPNGAGRFTMNGKDLPTETIDTNEFASKELYGNTTVNVGRKAGSTIGESSFCWGNPADTDSLTASGSNSTALGGSANEAIGTNSTVLGGSSNKADGSDGIVLGGRRNKTSGYQSIVAGGRDNTSSGNCTAVLGGAYNTASGNFACAEGYYTNASGENSHAEGYLTNALNNQHVQGHCNDTSKAYAGSSSGANGGTAFCIGNGTTSTHSNAVRIDYNGKLWCKQAYSSSGADYAELFEWKDSNPDNEDRRGYFVTTDGDKIRIASPDDNFILGIVSANPAVLGNTDMEWQGQFMKDEFGDFIKEKHMEIIKEPNIDETGNMIEIEREIEVEFYKVNPNYDPDAPYTDRLNRPEWDAVGMMGVLSVYDDGTCEVNGFCTVAKDGIATSSKTGYRVIKRVTDNIIKVIFK